MHARRQIASSDLQVVASARIDENGELILPPGWQTPLEYMMTVVNDESADVDRRDRLAATAAPYFHSRVSGQYISERATTLEQAKSAGRGTEWARVLKTID
jgi:hypothetical protein